MEEQGEGDNEVEKGIRRTRYNNEGREEEMKEKGERTKGGGEWRGRYRRGVEERP